jgi:hypothetical protein
MPASTWHDAAVPVAANAGRMNAGGRCGGCGKAAQAASPKYRGTTATTGGSPVSMGVLGRSRTRHARAGIGHGFDHVAGLHRLVDLARRAPAACSITR